MKTTEKTLQYFEGKVVRKDLTSRVRGNSVVPTYVLEYLLGQYCAVADEKIVEDGIEKVKGIISDNFVHKAESELVKSTIREKKLHKIIDKITVTLNEKSDKYEAAFSNLGIKKVGIADLIVNTHKKLLSGGGVWCIITLGYDTSEDATTRWLIESLKPIQVSGVDQEEYILARKNFTTDEWLDLLMHSIGLNPEFFNRRGKIIQLSRLITHVENNFNIVELGPKGTGKSHVFSELSPHGVLVSGGDVTSARLFVNNVGKGQVGLVGYWDVVCLDEFEQVIGSKRSDGDMVNIMQNYMANKSFNRGKETIQAYASMAFVGNTKRPVPYMLKNSNLFESIPLAYIKGAFLDRIHLYIPGWEVPILKESMLSKDYGFIVDYLAEILREFRKYDYSDLLDKYVELDPSYTGRDKMAVRKTFSGLVKLIFPDKVMDEKEALSLIEFAIEGRRRVKEQLYKIDETFRSSPVTFAYKELTTGNEQEVETLEKINYLSGSDPTKKEEPQVSVEKDASDRFEKPKPGQVHLRDNQTGISYLKLFGNYLKDVQKIKLIDPYIRLPYQFRNLMEFCLMLSQIKHDDDQIELQIISWNTEDHMADSINNFEELSDSVSESGIKLTYEFADLHDRSIVAENGWKIILGRGLDMFEPYEGKFNVASLDQGKRKCKDCEITFIYSKGNNF